MENMGIKLFAFGVSALDIFSFLLFFQGFLFLFVVGFPFVFLDPYHVLALDQHYIRGNQRRGT